jgi:PPP family 3-phenylpropionic acid transporter
VNLSPASTLSLAYFAYFAVLGVFVPYIGLFLDERGLNSHDIGVLLAIVTGMRIVGPSLWAALALKRRDPIGVMRFGAVLASIGWLSSFYQGGYWPLVAGLALYSLCWTAILPQLESAAFHYLNNETARYSKVRTAGSVGYIVLVMLGGWWFQQTGPQMLPHSALLFLLLMLITLWLLPKYRIEAPANAEPLRFRRLWTHGPFLKFMLGAFFMQMSFAPFYGFFTLYTRDLGYSGSDAGLLIALAVAAEIVAFFYAGRILSGRSYQKLLGLCYGVTAIRWLMVAFVADSGWLLAASMLLHAFSFAIAHSCAMQFIQEFFPEHQRSRGQALYAGLIYGGGGAVGAYVAGIAWQDGAGSTFTFVLGAGCALLSMGLALSLPKKIPSSDANC